eukprot:GGOE01006708.1.p3 GENE.GGOE01006708.1~~GGOE01006708.1.p3  ORF type:complete len:119 (-),score=8.58 GGOE01006708.1:885-1241(-)
MSATLCQQGDAGAGPLTPRRRYTVADGCDRNRDELHCLSTTAGAQRDMPKTTRQHRNKKEVEKHQFRQQTGKARQGPAHSDAPTDVRSGWVLQGCGGLSSTLWRCWTAFESASKRGAP